MIFLLYRHFSRGIFTAPGCSGIRPAHIFKQTKIITMTREQLDYFMEHYKGQVNVAEAVLRRAKIQLLVYKIIFDKLPEMPKQQAARFIDAGELDNLILLIRKGGNDKLADFIQEVVDTN